MMGSTQPKGTSTSQSWVRRCLLVALVACTMLGSAATPAHAARLEIVFKDGLWGAGIGALIGTAQVLMFKDPSNEYYRIPYGAAVGAIVGVIFGVVDASGALSSNDPGTSGALATFDYDHNLLVIAAPAFVPVRTERSETVMMNLLEAKF